MSEAVSRWPYRVKEWFRSMSVRVRSVVDEAALRQTFLQVLLFSHVSIIIPMFLTYVHLRVAITRWKNRRSLGIFQKALSVIGRHSVERI